MKMEINDTRREQRYNRPVVAAFALPVVKRQKPQNGNKRSQPLCGVGRSETHLHSSGHPGRTDTTCIFHIFGSLILRCYIYMYM